jgi:DnaJ-domain-containing protein 1
VPSPSQGAPPSRWPEDSRRLAEDLQRRLAIDGRDWHALKGQKPRRAAEQIAAALVQLLGDDSPPHRRGGEAQQRAIDLLEHGLGWLKGERSDPGCPSHGGGQGAG